jgi:hypothetical protein
MAGSDTALRDDERHYLINALVEAWPAVKEAKASSDIELLRAAQAVVDKANEAFGGEEPEVMGRRQPGLLPP